MRRCPVADEPAEYLDLGAHRTRYQIAGDTLTADDGRHIVAAHGLTAAEARHLAAMLTAYAERSEIS